MAGAWLGGGTLRPPPSGFRWRERRQRQAEGNQPGTPDKLYAERHGGRASSAIWPEGKVGVIKPALIVLVSASACGTVRGGEKQE